MQVNKNINMILELAFQMVYLALLVTVKTLFLRLNIFNKFHAWHNVIQVLDRIVSIFII